MRRGASALLGVAFERCWCVRGLDRHGKSRKMRGVLGHSGLPRCSNTEHRWRGTTGANTTQIRSAVTGFSFFHVGVMHV
jgi:hypothetical protein